MDDLAEKRRLILQRVGECIMAWSTVEWNITLLYGECIGQAVTEAPGNWLHASVVDSVVSLDARLDMVEAALEFHAYGGFEEHGAEHVEKWKPTLTEWTSLRAQIRKRYKKRSAVAHSTISQANTGDGPRIGLVPFPTLSGLQRNNGAMLSADQLQERARLFEGLCNRIQAFIHQVRAALGKPPRFLGQPPNASPDRSGG